MLWQRRAFFAKSLNLFKLFSSNNYIINVYIFFLYKYKKSAFFVKSNLQILEFKGIDMSFFLLLKMYLQTVKFYCLKNLTFKGWGGDLLVKFRLYISSNSDLNLYCKFFCNKICFLSI